MCVSNSHNVCRTQILFHFYAHIFLYRHVLIVYKKLWNSSYLQNMSVYRYIYICTIICMFVCMCV